MQTYSFRHHRQGSTQLLFSLARAVLWRALRLLPAAQAILTYVKSYDNIYGQSDFSSNLLCMSMYSLC